MHFDSPAIIHECDGCGKKHQSMEHWISCLIQHLKLEREKNRQLQLKQTESGRFANALPVTKGGMFEALRDKKK